MYDAKHLNVPSQDFFGIGRRDEIDSAVELMPAANSLHSSRTQSAGAGCSSTV